MSNHLTFKTAQESFWAGDFGSSYIERNNDPQILASNIALFSRILRSLPCEVSSFTELGANIGLNLRALYQLFPNASFHGVEINPQACEVLRNWCETIYHGTISECSIFDWSPEEKVDFSFTKGVLIHISPDHLPIAYEKLYNSSRKYILVAEYFNPVPATIPYRGHNDRLFKRDFAGEMMDYYRDLELVDYGFVYRRDPLFPLDDITWFLMKKL